MGTEKQTIDEEGAENSPSMNVVQFSKTRQQKFNRLYEEYQAIEKENAWDAGEVGYINSVMVQATLPYREPKGNPAVWGRTSGEWSLVIQPGMYLESQKQTLPSGKTKITNVAKSIGYPFGSKPRLLLAWLGREIKHQKSPEIKLGRSLSAFLHELGLDDASGGPNGSITQTKEQMLRLFSSRIAMVKTPTIEAVNWEVNGMQIADRQQLWWDPSKPAQAGLFESTVVLSQKFYDEFSNGVPIDMRALRALKASPFELDLYCWLTYRFFTLHKRTVVPWEALQVQFGTETVCSRKFKWKLRDALKSVLSVYPDAKVDPTQDAGLVLLPSKTSVSRLIAMSR